MTSPRPFSKGEGKFSGYFHLHNATAFVEFYFEVLDDKVVHAAFCQMRLAFWQKHG